VSDSTPHVHGETSHGHAGPDPAHTHAAHPGAAHEPVRIDPEGVALLVVDMQNGFCHPDGDIGRRGQGGPLQAVVPSVGRLVDLAHDVGLDVYWSRQEHLAADVTKRHRQLRGHHHGEGRIHSPAERGTWDAEIEPSLAARIRPSDYVFSKHRASCFYNTSLEVMLRMRGVRFLIVCGVTTNYCVDSTIRDAYARDFELVLVGDCCAALDRDLHDAVLRNTDKLHGTVLSLDEVAAALGQVPMTAARTA
jgi:ureidoacrylate peracid hydrolase